MVSLDVDLLQQAYVSDRVTGLTLLVVGTTAEIRQGARIVMRGLGPKAKDRVIAKFNAAALKV